MGRYIETCALDADRWEGCEPCHQGRRSPSLCFYLFFCMFSLILSLLLPPLWLAFSLCLLACSRAATLVCSLCCARWRRSTRPWTGSRTRWTRPHLTPRSSCGAGRPVYPPPPRKKGRGSGSCESVGEPSDLGLLLPKIKHTPPPPRLGVISRDSCELSAAPFGNQLCLF